jgi:hypothetical protein
MARFVAHRGQAIPPIQLALRPAARVHGTFTFGKERRPLAAELVTLHRRDEGAESGILRRGAGNGSALEISRSGQTDEQGRFEFFAGPGRYSIAVGPPVYVQIIGPDMMSKSISLEADVKEFEITNQPEIEVNFATARPPAVDFDGRVALKADPNHGVADVTIHVAPIDPRNTANFRPVRTDADGAFHAKRRPCEMLVEAESADGSLSGLVRVFADETKVSIPIGPSASARGVILDATTGRPVVKQRIICGIRLDFAHGGFRLAAPGGAVTNRQGKFELSGLPRGWKFECYAQVGPRTQATTRFVRLCEFKTDETTTIDIGQIKLVAAPGGAPPDLNKPL